MARSLRLPQPDDLRVFLTVLRAGSFAAAADELGQSPAYISKRVRILEATLGTRLLHRNSRQLALTDDGESTRRHALQILDACQQLDESLAEAREQPRGTLHLCSSLGFGRHHVAPAVARLAARYPQLDIRLDLFDRQVDLLAEGFDLEVRVGNEDPGPHHGRRLAGNRRVLCASPAYLQRRGQPRTLADLVDHDCLVIKERDNAFGIWRLTGAGETQAIKVGGRLSSNHGEVALQWALEGHGIVLRSQWDVAPLLASRRLLPVLPAYGEVADIWALYPSRLAHSGKLRACVEFLQQQFRNGLPQTPPDGPSALGG